MHLFLLVLAQAQKLIYLIINQKSHFLWKIYKDFSSINRQVHPVPLLLEVLQLHNTSLLVHRKNCGPDRQRVRSHTAKQLHLLLDDTLEVERISLQLRYTAPAQQLEKFVLSQCVRVRFFSLAGYAVRRYLGRHGKKWLAS